VAYDVVNDPVGATFGAMADGKLTGLHVKVLQDTRPKLYGDMKGKLLNTLAIDGPKLNFNQRQQVRLFLGGPAPSRFIQQMQKTFAAEPAPQSTPAPKRGGAPKRQITKVAEQLKLAGS
ncbi:MAG TPA: hypothetical protein VI159_01525, partial [Gemmatimonadales bacterium]